MCKVLLVLTASLLAASCSTSSPRLYPISGRVISVDPIVLDVGKRDGVEKGMRFVIKSLRGVESRSHATVVLVGSDRCVATHPGEWKIPVRDGRSATADPGVWQVPVRPGDQAVQVLKAE